MCKTIFIKILLVLTNVTRTSEDERCEIALARDHAIQFSCIDLIHPPLRLNNNNNKGVVYMDNKHCDFESYNKMRIINPDKFWKTTTQRRMYEDQVGLGHSFYSTAEGDSDECN